MYKLIKKYYDMGIYTEADVLKFVAAGTISQEQAQEIIGGSV